MEIIVGAVIGAMVLLSIAVESICVVMAVFLPALCLGFVCERIAYRLAWGWKKR